MKGLTHIPAQADLAEAYARLQSAMVKPSLRIPVEDLALWSQWSRFDPRLAEQVVDHFVRRWRLISPLALRDGLFAQPWPEALAALLEQAGALARLRRPEEAALYRAWMGCAVSGVRRAPGEQYFIGLAAPGGDRMSRTAERSLRTFSKWGYLCEEVLANKAFAPGGPAHRKTWLGLEARLRILAALLQRMPSVNVRDYLREVGGGLTLRQAQRDLRRLGGLEAVGRTRARRYRRSRAGSRSPLGI